MNHITSLSVALLSLFAFCACSGSAGPATGGGGNAGTTQTTGGKSNAGGAKASGGGSAMTVGGSGIGGSSNGECVSEQGSCTQGETCCVGLTCCVGVPVPAGSEYCGTTCPRSDQALKRGFASVNEADVLDRLVRLPVSTWSYKTEGTQVQHLGPMAQDFKAAFGLGESDRTILQVDADGVAFAAIHALYARLIELESSNRTLTQRLRELEAETQQCRVPERNANRPK